MSKLNDLAALLALAGQHAEDDASAEVCLADALATAERGRLGDAAGRAVDSLKYSIGLFHPDFKKAQQLAARIRVNGHNHFAPIK
jgi:hypothetical protein